MSRTHAHAKIWNCRRGTAAIEFALVAPALLLTLFGTIEFGRLMWTQSALHFAVQEAARCASVSPSVCGTPTQTASYAAGKVTQLNIAASTFTSSSAACGHKVSASFAYQFVATELFPYAPTLTAQACMA